ncbi:MAG: ABC transporter substrate-binding protein [Mangrovicoccus sp.]
MNRFMTLLGAALWALPAYALEIETVYLRQLTEPPKVLSNLDARPEDLGLAGAQLGLADNATTGQFMGQNYRLSVTDVEIGGDLIAAAKDSLAQSRLLVIDASAAEMQAIADLPEAAGALLFNATAAENELRDGGCRANLFHTTPSRAMLADALIQFLAQKRWANLALIAGPRPGDQAFAAALEQSSKKFRLNLRDREDWSFDADMRRSAGAELPLFTQNLRSHDILLVADEVGDYARYIPYNTWSARPVAGSTGLSPVAWSRVVEQWGAAQLQSRFTDQHGRPMQAGDYGAWAALRAIGEAVTRTGSADPAVLRAYMLGDQFALAGFKGRPLSFRAWNGQLRQPIPLVTSDAAVAMAPMEDFLHQGNELDTLGLDQPDSSCTAFNE